METDGLNGQTQESRRLLVVRGCHNNAGGCRCMWTNASIGILKTESVKMTD